MGFTLALAYALAIALASSITIVSDAPNCGVTYDRHYDDRNIIQATGDSNSATTS